MVFSIYNIDFKFTNYFDLRMLDQAIKSKIYRIDKIFLIFFIILLLLPLLLVAYDTFFPQKIGTKVSIPFNFLLQPHFQDKPKVFVDGSWGELPNSQQNIITEDGKKFISCGKGGLMVYDMSNNQLTYLFKQDWYPCRSIFVEGVNLIVEDTYGSEGRGRRLTFNLQDNIQTDSEEITDEEVLSNHRLMIDQRPETSFYKKCDEISGACAELNEDNTVVVVNKEGSDKHLSINDAYGIVGFKDNILFYATSEGSCPERPATKKISQLFIRTAYACYINHHLYAYNINTDEKEKILTDFRYDSDWMIFF